MPGLARSFVLILAALVSLSFASVRAYSCEIALVLAIDASSSVSDSEYKLQIEGTANALLSEDVTNAILALNGVYLSGFEWNGQTNQSMLFNWTRLESRADIQAVANKIFRHIRNNRKAPTALGEALVYSKNLLQRVPEPCFRQVIDVSGDGESNDGRRPRRVYGQLDFTDINVNGLAIVNPKRRDKSYFEAVDLYYEDELIRGPGAFVIVAEGFQDFARAIKEKLLREFAPSAIGFLETNKEIR